MSSPTSNTSLNILQDSSNFIGCKTYGLLLFDRDIKEQDKHLLSLATKYDFGAPKRNFNTDLNSSEKLRLKGLPSNFSYIFKSRASPTNRNAISGRAA